MGDSGLEARYLYETTQCRVINLSRQKKEKALFKLIHFAPMPICHCPDAGTTQSMSPANLGAHVTREFKE